MTNASSSGCWRQFAGQNAAPILQPASKQLDEPERVLAEPQHTVAALDAGRRQRVGDIDARVRSASRHVSVTSPSTSAIASGRVRA